MEQELTESQELIKQKVIASEEKDKKILVFEFKVEENDKAMALNRDAMKRQME